MPLETIDIPLKGIVVHLKGFDFVKGVKIEEYHRGIKQFCGVEKRHLEPINA